MILIEKILMKKIKCTMFWEKYKIFFNLGARKFRFPIYKKYFFPGFPKSLLKYKKFFSEKKYKGFLIFGLGSLISRNIRKTFLRKSKNFFRGEFFLFFELGLKLALGSSIYSYSWYMVCLFCYYWLQFFFIWVN